jgi:ribosomal protein L27
MQLKTVKTYDGSKIQSSQDDDFFVIDDGKTFTNQNGEKFETGCKVFRNSDETLLYALSCPHEFKIIDKSSKVLYASRHLSLEKNGAVKSFFTNGPSASLV